MPAQQILNRGLQGRTRRRLVERLTKQRDRAREVCGRELGVAEEDERLGTREAPGARSRRSRASARPSQLARRDVRACGRDRAAMTILSSVGRRQAERVLAELSGRDGCAAGIRQGRCVL